MKLQVITTVAAGLVAGIASFNTATDASAGIVNGYCATVNGGTINKPGTTSFSGWITGLCMRHNVSTNATRRVRALGVARFNNYEGRATFSRIQNCFKSAVIFSFYRLSASGAGWQKVAGKKVNAIPIMSGGRITNCTADAGTSYVTGSALYRTVVMAVDGGGQSTGIVLRSKVRSHPWS